jgi:predicted RNA-binding protein associated with RNAse of E/G family
VKDEISTISISWAKDLKLFGSYVPTTVKEYIENYISEKINEKKVSPFNFHLMSNVYLVMKDGFIIKNLHFTSK